MLGAEGRVILDNLIRFIKFSLGGNLGKVLVVLATPLIGITVALLPLQLLWLNLLTDGLLGLGLGFEPGEPDTMRRPVRPPQMLAKHPASANRVNKDHAFCRG